MNTIPSQAFTVWTDGESLQSKIMDVNIHHLTIPARTCFDCGSPLPFGSKVIRRFVNGTMQSCCKRCPGTLLLRPGRDKSREEYRGRAPEKYRGFTGAKGKERFISMPKGW